jgi:hypothetical protein
MCRYAGWWPAWYATRWKRDGSCRMRDNPHSRGAENPSATKPNRRARLSPLGVPADLVSHGISPRALFGRAQRTHHFTDSSPRKPTPFRGGRSGASHVDWNQHHCKSSWVWIRLLHRLKALPARGATAQKQPPLRGPRTRREALRNTARPAMVGLGRPVSPPQNWRPTISDSDPREVSRKARTLQGWEAYD